MSGMGPRRPRIMKLIKEEQEFTITGKGGHESDKRIQAEEIIPIKVADEMQISKSQSQLVIHPKRSAL